MYLERSSCQQNTIASFKGTNSYRERRRLVLQTMSFIDDQVLEAEFVECVPLDIANLICSHNHVPIAILVSLPWLQDCIDNVVTRSFVTVEFDNVQGWRPARKFVHPVTQSTLRNDNQMRTSDISIFLHENENGYRLQRL